jgi:hypothetical protein
MLAQWEARRQADTEKHRERARLAYEGGGGGALAEVCLAHAATPVRHTQEHFLAHLVGLYSTSSQPLARPGGLSGTFPWPVWHVQEVCVAGASGQRRELVHRSRATKRYIQQAHFLSRRRKRSAKLIDKQHLSSRSRRGWAAPESDEPAFAVVN